MARPETIDCEVCGATVEVAARGRVPRFCANHSAADLPAVVRTTADPEPTSPVGEVVDVDHVDDGWPRQIAPIVWLDQNGRRYTDLSDAQRGAQEIRDR